MKLRTPIGVSLIAALLSCCSMVRADESLQSPYSTWSQYLGGVHSAHYSSLTQINASNVGKLQIAWRFPTGDNTAYVFSPIIVSGVMYVLAQNTSIVALDAGTGKELWAHKITPPGMISNPFEAHGYKGIAYWQSKDGSDRRIIFVGSNYLQEIDASTGKVITSFGQNGLVDLREGLGRDPRSINHIQSGTPGRVFENLIIEGSSTGEDYGAPPGDIRAYNVLTGKIEWTFHTIPHPGEVGYDTWPAGVWKTASGANCWGEMTIDEKRGIVYIPTASAKNEFYGGERLGKNLFADSLIALNARNGKLLWCFQAVHHDIWDYDIAAAPQLLRVQHNGKRVDVVAIAGKDGFAYVFNRVTGEPLWPIVERPVPKSDVPGEMAWPTQPLPTLPPPFGRQHFSIADINPFLSANDQASLRAKLLDARSQGLFTPPALQPTLEMPGNNGGANFMGTAADPTNGTFFVVSKAAPSIIQLKRTPPPMHFRLPGTPAQQGRILYHANCDLCHGTNLEGKPPAIPALNGVVNTLNASAVKRLIQSGMGQMPAFKDLSDSQVDAIIAFLKDPKSGAPSPGQPAFFVAPARSPEQPVNTKIPVRYWTGYGYLETPTIPTPLTPPWSTLTSYDLNTGSINWQIPFGDAPDASKGYGELGSIWPRNGVVVTGGGLIFAAPRSSGALYAYDEKTGAVLWKTELPAASEGVPAVYEVNGREYLVVCATSPKGSTHGVRSSEDKFPRSYIAYALPTEINTAER